MESCAVECALTNTRVLKGPSHLWTDPEAISSKKNEVTCDQSGEVVTLDLSKQGPLPSLQMSAAEATLPRVCNLPCFKRVPRAKKEKKLREKKNLRLAGLSELPAYVVTLKSLQVRSANGGAHLQSLRGLTGGGRCSC